MKSNMQNYYPRFAVIGAGNGGQAMAAHLAIKGFTVNLYNRTIEKVAHIKQKGFISLEGAIKGRGELNIVTDNMKDAIEDTDIIMVTVPASGHRDIAVSCIPYLRDGQIIVLNPGRTGGALEFFNILKSEGLDKKVVVAETQTFIYACRIIDPGRVKIYSIKNQISLAALPAEETSRVIRILSMAYPQFVPASNVLETSLNNIGAVFHPAPTILNCGRIESTKGSFDYYTDGITPSVAKVIEEIDEERIRVAKALGVNTITAQNWLELSYGSSGESLYEAIQNTAGYKGIKAPPTMDVRYIFEDIPESLVPISSMGSMLDIDTPTIDSIIQLASTIHDVDYFKIGRNTINLGIEGLTVDQITDLVNHGEVGELEGVVA